MTLRPPKRQKTLHFARGDERSPSPTNPPCTTPAAQPSRGLSPTRPCSSLASESTKEIPRKTVTNKARVKASKASKKASATRGIHSFFNSITEAQTKTRTPNDHCPDVELQEKNDLIEDDLSVQASSAKSQRVDTKKPLSSGLQLPKTPFDQEANSTNGSKKFAHPNNHSTKEDCGSRAKDEKENDLSAWVDLYPPQTIGELAVHPKKISAIIKWLQEINPHFAHKNLLILKGPAGSGKSVAVRVIAEAHGLEILDWSNPVGRDYKSEEFTSLAAQFDDFLNRSLRYATLNASICCLDRPGQASGFTDGTSQKSSFVLIDDFPNTFSRSSSALAAFRLSILRYMATGIARQDENLKNPAAAVDPLAPIIMLFSETSATASTESTETFTVGRVLGPDIMHHPATTIIELNAPSSALITKALNCIVRKHMCRSRRGWTPSPRLVKELSQLGDIRSAVNALEFTYVSDRLRKQGRDHLLRYADTFSSPNAHESDWDQALKFAHRGHVLDIFHAVAKVMYNKRNDEQETGLARQVAQPPDYLTHHARPRISEVSSEMLMETVSTDTETFVAALHENYIYSCSDRSFIESFDDCIDILSTVDVLNLVPQVSVNSTRHMLRQASGSNNVDMFRQTEIIFHTAVRGLLFALPHPVNRGAHPGASTHNLRDPYKMIYPTSVRISRQISDAEVLIGYWSRAIESRLGPHEILLRYWFQKTDQPLLQGDLRTGSSVRTQTDHLPLSSCNHLGRTEIVLGYLPYLINIMASLPPTAAIRDLQDLVTFGVLSVPTLEDKRRIVGESIIATPSPLLQMSLRGSFKANLDKNLVSSATSQFPSAVVPVDTGLVLSDDDIEDI